MIAPGEAPLRYLSAADVAAAMPPLSERIRLAERTMTALVGDAELPPKIGVHPRPAGSFAHAMPAHLRGPDPAGTADLLGIKWIAGFPANRGRALPAIHGLVVLTDPLTGIPSAILDAGPITAERTAAISGLAIARFVPAVAGRPLPADRERRPLHGRQEHADAACRGSGRRRCAADAPRGPERNRVPRSRRRHGRRREGARRLGPRVAGA